MIDIVSPAMRISNVMSLELLVFSVRNKQVFALSVQLAEFVSANLASVFFGDMFWRVKVLGPQ